jgi:hypothetical protein
LIVKQHKNSVGFGAMRHRLMSSIVCAALLLGGMPTPLRAQDSVAADNAAQGYSVEQLDALLAPIALYPDDLLAQVLIASAYPLEVVAAARWRQDPANGGLQGDALTGALAQQNWDPSVKSLVAFPQVLEMMNSQLDWLQQLGYAMNVQQDAVMDSIQRLRRQAQIADQLKTTDQQIVSMQGQVIVIAPAQPNVIYVPAYNPTIVYGAWPYPSYPPVYLPPPPGYVVGTALAAGIAFGVGVGITAGLWGWASPNWGHRNVYVNVNRYNTINVNRPPINNPAWRPNGARPPGGYRPPPGPVGRPGRPTTLPAPGPGRPGAVPGGTRPPVAPGGNRPVNPGGNARPGGEQSAPNFGNRPAGQPPKPPAAGNRPPNPGGNARPGGGQSAPNFGNRPAGQPPKPPAAGNRPANPGGNARPGGGQSAPNFGNRPAGQPPTPPAAGNRPAIPGGNARPGGGPAAPNLANRPAGQPTPRPPAAGNRPAIPGGNGRPGGGQAAPNFGNRPAGQPTQRPPAAGNRPAAPGGNARPGGGQRPNRNPPG